MEMRGGVIFDNSSIFDASVSSLRDQVGVVHVAEVVVRWWLCGGGCVVVVWRWVVVWW